MTPLDFRSVRDAGSQSWVRARESLADGAALIEQQRWNAWLVMLDGGDAHLVRCEREHGAVVGTCGCDGVQSHGDAGRPCAHLCAVRMGDVISYPTTNGRSLRIVDQDRERADAIDRAAATDRGTIHGRRLSVTEMAE